MQSKIRLALIFSLIETNAPPFEKGGAGGDLLALDFEANSPFPKGDFALHRYWLKINANRDRKRIYQNRHSPLCSTYNARARLVTAWARTHWARLFVR
jgi:hypothetical protein